jgi:hypothetical protein
MGKLKDIKNRLVLRTKVTARRWKAQLRSKERRLAAFREEYIADTPVDLDLMREYRAENFPSTGPAPWLDRDNAEAEIGAKLKQGQLSAAEAEQCRKWRRDGYVVLNGLFDHAFLDRVWNAYEEKSRSGKLKLDAEKVAADDPYPGRFLNPHLRVREIKELLFHKNLKTWTELLLGREAAPFQTITAHKGSQQKEHSDSIHMTTYPLGYLTAAWIAFEDIRADSGPLVYYPGSHRLPYIFSKDIGVAGKEFLNKGYRVYAEKYEPRIQQVIREHKLKPNYFMARKGDVLFWHANLIHGGAPRKSMKPSRKSIVCHFFTRGVVCYHDLSGVRADRAHRVRYTDAMKELMM